MSLGLELAYPALEAVRIPLAYLKSHADIEL